jgi:hypothetical protein
MSNRLVCERVTDGWTCNGERLDGEPLTPAGRGDRAVARLRPEDLSIAPAGEAPGPGTAFVAATVLDAGYGGRHFDVFAMAGDTRVHARVPAGDQDSWTRKLEIGQPISVGFRPREAKLFDVSGENGAAAAPERQPVGA